MLVASQRSKGQDATSVEKMIQTLDENKDGEITKEEW